LPPARRERRVNLALKIFFRTRSRAIICSRRKNTDVMRVFAKADFQMFANRRARARACGGRFRGADGAKTAGFTTRKKICAGGPFCGVGGRFQPKNERIGAERFAAAARFATRCGTA